MSILAELKRRNVFRAGAAYVAVAWLIIQVAETTFPAFGLGEESIQLVILLLATGLVPALALSWAFELTPEGWKRDSEIEPGSALSRRTNRLLDRGIVVALVLGLAYFAFDKFILGPARDEIRIEEARREGRSEALVESYGDKSIAVLPFVNMSSDPEQEYFSDGMSEEILNLLAQIPELRVISRSSAFSIKGKDLTIEEVATQLNVAHVLEGSVRRSGNQVRVTAQLIEARTDTHLWSATWDRRLEDIFAIQDEVAAEVVSHLRLKLLGDLPASRRANPEAHLLYLQATHMLKQGMNPDLEVVARLLRKAIELDPGYADPWTGLAWLYYRCYTTTESNPFCSAVPAEQALVLHDEVIEKALAIDPENATALAYRAYHLATRNADFTAAAMDFERAIKLAPADPNVLRAAVIFARMIRRPDQAIRIGEYLLSRDPVCAICTWQLARAYVETGQYEQAEGLLRSLVLADQGGRGSLGMALVLAGKPEVALEVYSESHLLKAPEILHGRAIALHALGRHAESAEALAALESSAGSEHPLLVAEVYAWTGNLEAASDWLKKVVEMHQPGGLRWYPTSLFLQPVLALPAWQDHLRELGLTVDQLAVVPFAPRLPGT